MKTIHVAVRPRLGALLAGLLLLGCAESERVGSAGEDPGPTSGLASEAEIQSLVRGLDGATAVQAPPAAIDPAPAGAALGAPEQTSAAAADAAARILFGDSSPGLSDAERREILGLLDLRLASNQPGVLVDGVCGAPVEASARAEDLNGDGLAEVWVEIGSLCLYGGTGVGTTLFIRDGGGRFRANLGFPGMIVDVLPERRDGFPDLLVGGMGFCFGVWGWDGSAYAHVRNEAQEPGGCG